MLQFIHSLLKWCLPSLPAVLCPHCPFSVLPLWRFIKRELQWLGVWSSSGSSWNFSTRIVRTLSSLWSIWSTYMNETFEKERNLTIRTVVWEAVMLDLSLEVIKVEDLTFTSIAIHIYKSTFTYRNQPLVYDIIIYTHCRFYILGGKKSYIFYQSYCCPFSCVPYFTTFFTHTHTHFFGVCV